jgi:glycosyltransferase involved in cell wall biosynthesis
VVAHLTDALVDLGHEVTLFASADAETQAELVVVRDQAIRLDPEPLKSDVAAHLSMLQEVRRRADEFDVLHFHLELLHFPFFEHLAARTLTTLHGRQDLKDLAEVYRRWPAFPLCSISDRQRTPLPDAHWTETVYHGFPTDLFRYTAEPRGGYLAFLGRFSPEKGADRAIAFARRVGIPLRLAAKVDDDDRAYFHEVVEPLLEAPSIEYVGEINDGEKSEFLGNASALLFPIDWPEPFGLVLIEAMACGTPVIAWRSGSVPEIVENGVTGEIVESEEEAVAALPRVAALDRGEVRRAFERRFSAPVMARHYVSIYERLVAGEGRR